MAYMTNEWHGKEHFPIHDFHHLEFLTGNAKQAVHYYRSAFGFEPYAYCGPETGIKDAVSYVLKNNRQYFVITTPLNSSHPGSDWLKTHGVPFSDIDLHMRPTDKYWHFMKDSDLKQHWLDNLELTKDNVFAVFDDRQQVVDMWRKNGLTTFQVADGNF